MIRNQLIERKIGQEDGFRRRGGEVSRVEGFSDAVFAFAITLLVVSLEVPHDFTSLLNTMKGFGAFAVCFMMLMLVWHWHYRFFRRFGLQDNVIILLNSVLLFLVLFYVYPLKFLFTVLLGEAFGPVKEPLAIEPSQWPTLMLIYGLGFISVHLVFAILYYYAHRKREQLELTPSEDRKTLTAMGQYIIIASIGLVSVLISATGNPDNASIAGWTYLLIMPAVTIYRSVEGRRDRMQTESEQSR